MPNGACAITWNRKAHCLWRATRPCKPGDTIVSSELAHPVTVNAPVAQVSAADIAPSIPLRLISLSHRSAYSSAADGLLPFEISTAPADRVRADTVVDRKPVLSYLDPHDPQAAAHILSGLFPDAWMSERASVLLKTPEKPTSVEVVLYIPEDAPARHVQLLVDGQLGRRGDFSGSWVLQTLGAIPDFKPHCHRDHRRRQDLHRAR